MEIVLQFRDEKGVLVEIVREVSSLSVGSTVSDVGNLVKAFGCSILPDLENKLMLQLQAASVGEKNTDI